MANQIQFIAGTLEQFKASAKDSSTLYFLEDCGKIFKGSVDVTASAVIVPEFPELANAVEGKLYIHQTTAEIKLVVNGAYVTASPAIVKDVEGWAAEGSGDKLASVAVIKAAINAAVAEVKNQIEGGENLVTEIKWNAESGNGDGKLVVTRGNGTTNDVVLNGVPYSITYEDLVLTVKAYGQEPVVINLPKDNFVRSGSYDAETQELVIVVDDDEAAEGTKEIRIGVGNLIDVYTGASSDTVEVTIANNQITAKVRIDDSANNAIQVTDKGIKVDVSNKADKLTTTESDAGIILVLSQDGNYAKGGAKLLKSTDTVVDGDAQVPTYKAVDDKLVTPVRTTAESAKSTAEANKGNIESHIGKKDNPHDVTAEQVGAAKVGDFNDLKDRVSSLENQDKETEEAIQSLNGDLAKKIAIKATGNADEIMTSTADGDIKRSSKKIGGSTLAASPSSDTVATEAAVDAAIKGAALTWGTF